MKTYKDYITEADALTPFKYSLEYNGVKNSDPCLRYVSKKDKRHIYTFGKYTDKIKITFYDDMWDTHYIGFCPRQIKNFSDIALSFGTDYERKAVAISLEKDGATVQEINAILKKV